MIFKSEYTLIIDLPDPDSIPVEERAVLRTACEREKFDDEHYLADTFDNTEIVENYILAYKTELDEQEYTEDEMECLKNLPKRTYLLDKEQKMFAYCGLFDILFSYSYNKRINCGEENSEAGWTITKLSSTLCWLDVFRSPKSAVVASLRRSLCFPLIRNWKVSKAALKDTVELLKHGRKHVIKALLEIRKTFIDGDCRYILNDLYINDYCVWIQHLR